MRRRPAPDTYLPTWNEAADSMSTSCTPASQLVPLTKDTKVLKDTIDGFAASGNTAGQLGTAFAWYLLSPNWNTVWPADSQVTAYGTPKVDKIAMLMTDGEYNTVQAITTATAASKLARRPPMPCRCAQP